MKNNGVITFCIAIFFNMFLNIKFSGVQKKPIKHAEYAICKKAIFIFGKNILK